MDDIGKATTLKSFEGLDLMAHYNSKLNLVPISNTQVIQVEKDKIVVRLNDIRFDD